MVRKKPHPVLNRFVFAVVCVAALCAAGCSKSGVSANSAAFAMPPVAVRVVPAEASDVPLDVAAIGNVEAIATVDVKARITAPVLHVNFQEGQDVTKGQLLFELD